MNDSPIRSPLARKTAEGSIQIVFDERQTAEMLDLSVKTLRNWRSSGEGPRFTRLGRAIRYPLAAIHEFIEAGMRSSTSDTLKG